VYDVEDAAGDGDITAKGIGEGERGDGEHLQGA